MDEQIEKPKNKTRKADILFRVIFAILGVGGTYGTYKQFADDKPLYDTFQTKPEGAMIQSSVEALRQTVNTNQVVTMQTLSDMSKRQDESFREIKAMIDSQRTAMQRYGIDIENLKFVVLREKKPVQ